MRKELHDREEFKKILYAYQYRGYDKGVRGIYTRLLRSKTPMNPKKIRRLMRKYGLFCPIRQPNPYRRMMKELRSDVVADNLVDRKFKEYGPRMVLLTDITYIRVQEDFCYLSTIIDAYTKQVLSYVLSESLKVNFVLETVKQLVDKHKISLSTKTYIHSDQGAHYTSTDFRTLVQDEELVQSMSRKANCWDNAPQESFFGHMKDELKKYSKSWTCFEDVRRRIDDWMDYYNNDRYQMTLQCMSPNEFYSYITTGHYPLDVISK